MKNLKFSLVTFFVLLAGLQNGFAQLHVRVVVGIISVDDIAPTMKKYAVVTDSLDRNLKIHPKDTSSLFSRALLYLQFNSFVVNPDLGSNKATDKLLLAKKLADRADSLKMKNFNLKVLRAQICKELTDRYAPIETWRFNDKQMMDRKKKFDYYKGLANRYYDELAKIDPGNAYDYQKLKVQ